MWKDELFEQSGILQNDSGITYRAIKLDNAEAFIEKLLKEQREICASTFEEYDSSTMVFNAIKNAPEPTLGAKDEGE